MIVKKLSDVSGGAFPGARYNEMKVAAGVAQLMAMENVSEALRHSVEILHHFSLDASAEIERYLKDRSQTYGNTKTTRFQFHVSASVKGRVMSPEELTDFARELMDGMGYARQPYFVYAHHDTGNNHVHILSTRIKPNGFPISDHQDRRRLNECANRILASDISKDIDHIFSYDYETEGQFANIVTAHGYRMEKSLNGYRLFKCGGNAGNIPIGDIFNRITKNSARRKERARQLRAIIRKYKSEIAGGKCHNVENVKVSEGGKKKPIRTKLNSDIKKILDSSGQPLDKETQDKIQQLLDTLKTRFGIDICFQKDRNGQVRGYGIVDHAGKIAFDGNKVMKLSELIDFTLQQERQSSPLDVYRTLFTVEICREGLNDYIRIHTKDGETYQKGISMRQYSWYHGVKPEEREDVGYMIAATMLSEEILATYLKQNPINNREESIKSVAVIRHRNGGYALRITMADGFSTSINTMTQEEINRYRAMPPSEQQEYLRKLAIAYFTHEDARTITRRIKEQTLAQTGTKVLANRTQDYPEQITRIFAMNLSAAISSLNVNTAHGMNREWEVGRRSRYDAIDNKQSGTQLSM